MLSKAEQELISEYDGKNKVEDPSPRIMWSWTMRRIINCNLGSDETIDGILTGSPMFIRKTWPYTAIPAGRTSFLEII